MQLKFRSYIQGLLVGAIVLVALFLSKYTAESVLAIISAYTASEFSQLCSDHPDTCVKENFSEARVGTLTCPVGLNTYSVYVHAGDGQTIYKLPHTGFELAVSSTSAQVTVTTHQHNLSWIALVCGGPTTSPQPTDPPCDCETSPSASSSASPSATASASPSTEPSTKPSEEPTPTPTPTPTPEPTPNTTKSSDTGSDNDVSNPSSPSEPQGEILGATLAATGVATDVIMNALGSVGGLMTVAGSVLYGKKKRS